jgi:serine/threonine-protein kinase
MIGRKLGHYEISAHLGTGGMGEVYQALDSKLGRSVAIKLLPEAFTHDHDRAARFEREARVLASLNHPNIAAIYGIEESGGRKFLVMELVGGETLAEHIRRGAIPVDEALGIAKEIAEGLEAAHEKGIIHRDLKPANVKIAADGKVKILDFGLAKAYEPGTEASTLTMGETEVGTILGTLAYMAPEQAMGKPVDKRADIYAFGVVLYEMLAGTRLHRGETATETLASVMRDEPRWEKVPAQVRRLLQSCLEKDPQKRLRHIGDVMRLADDELGPRAAAGGKAWLRLGLGVAALAVAATASWTWWQSTRLPDLPMTRQDVDLGRELALSLPLSYVSNVAISPNGERIAYVARASTGDRMKLFTRRLDQAQAVELPGTDQPAGPFFSSDGRQIGFVSNRKLYRISVDGGSAVPLMAISGTFVGASWSEDSIVVAQRNLPLMIVPAGGGPATPVTEMQPSEYIQSSPQFLPGGKAVLFSANSLNSTNSVEGLVPQLSSIEVVTLEDHRRRVLTHDGGTFPRYVASSGTSGHLLYTQKGAMYAIPFDPDKLETRGSAVPVLDDLTGAGSNGGFIRQAPPFDISRTGTLVYQKNASGRPVSTIQWFDSSGPMAPLLAKPGGYKSPRVSPDGKRLALTVQEGGSPDVQVYDWQNDRSTKLTFGGRFYADPVWTPDGQFVVFDAGVNMFWGRADGAGQPQLLMYGKATIPVPWSFSPDGKRLAFMEQGSGSQISILAIEIKDGQLKAGTPEPFLATPFIDAEPAFSPDGKWIAYQSNESGQRDEIYVRPFPASSSGQGGKWVISTNGGSDPHWSRAGHELLYKGPDGIMTAAYSVKDDMFVAEKPRLWRANFSGTDFDLAPDGKRLAVVVQTEAAPPEREAVFVENFFDELRRKVPASK